MFASYNSFLFLSFAMSQDSPTFTMSQDSPRRDKAKRTHDRISDAADPTDSNSAPEPPREKRPYVQWSREKAIEEIKKFADKDPPFAVLSSSVVVSQPKVRLNAHDTVTVLPDPNRVDGKPIICTAWLAAKRSSDKRTGEPITAFVPDSRIKITILTTTMERLGIKHISLTMNGEVFNFKPQGPSGAGDFVFELMTTYTSLSGTTTIETILLNMGPQIKSIQCPLRFWNDNRATEIARFDIVFQFFRYASTPRQCDHRVCMDGSEAFRVKSIAFDEIALCILNPKQDMDHPPSDYFNMAAREMIPPLRYTWADVPTSVKKRLYALQRKLPKADGVNSLVVASLMRREPTVADAGYGLQYLMRMNAIRCVREGNHRRAAILEKCIDDLLHCE
jgi:hypothetical protein